MAGWLAGYVFLKKFMSSKNLKEKGIIAIYVVENLHRIRLNHCFHDGDCHLLFDNNLKSQKEKEKTLHGRNNN